MTQTHETDDGAWQVSLTPLGMSSAAPPDGVLEIRVSGSLCRWPDDASADWRRTTSGEWRALGDGRYAIALHIGDLEVDAVLQRDGDEYAGRATLRERGTAARRRRRRRR